MNPNFASSMFRTDKQRLQLCTREENSLLPFSLHHYHSVSVECELRGQRMHAIRGKVKHCSNRAIDNKPSGTLRHPQDRARVVIN